MCQIFKVKNVPALKNNRTTLAELTYFKETIKSDRKQKNWTEWKPNTKLNNIDRSSKNNNKKIKKKTEHDLKKRNYLFTRCTVPI